MKQNRLMELHSLPDQIYILDENAFFNDMRLGKKERKRLNVNTALRKSLSFCLPGTKLSVDFFQDQVGQEVFMIFVRSAWYCTAFNTSLPAKAEKYTQDVDYYVGVAKLLILNTQVERYHLDSVLLKGTVESITPVIDCEDGTEADDERMKGRGREDAVRDGVKKTVKYFHVTLQEGDAIKARHVVMATGPTRALTANIPSWVRSIGESYPEGRLQHTVHLMHRLAAAQQNDAGSARPMEADSEWDFPNLSRMTMFCERFLLGGEDVSS